MSAGTVATHIYPVRIYYEDTDFSGSVYHANYLRYFERARSELLREIGVDQVALFGNGLGFVVRSIQVDYLRPARMNDHLRIETAIAKLGRASIEIDQSLWRDGEQLAIGKIRLALVGQGRPQPFPAELYAKLEMFRSGAFGASSE